MKSVLVGCVAACGLVLAGGRANAQPPQPAAAAPAHGVPFPHPLITEVLFNVPKGAAGDANGDGTRDAVGDEFVELINPHDKPIQLKGYVLSDSAGWPEATTFNPAAEDKAPSANDPPERAKPGTGAAPKRKSTSRSPATPGKPGDSTPGRRGAVKFVFPSLVLQPGERVVVFNGFKQRFSGPVGSASAPPAGKNPALGDAYVFSMHNASKFSSFSNTGDWVGLASPGGEAVEVFVWGVPTTLPPKAILSEEVPPGEGSYQRSAIDGPFERQADLPGDDAGTPFSPGRVPWKAPGGVPAAAPAPAPK